MAEIPLAIATLCAELHDLSELDRLGDRRPGGFVRKTITGRNYWYRQIWSRGKRQQKSIGVETPELLRRIEEERRQDALWRAEQRRRRTMCRALKAALNLPGDPISGRVIAALAYGGAFERGAVLIGTHAYRAFAPMLGVKLTAAALTTSDIDFAATVEVSIAAEASATAAVSFADIVMQSDPAFHLVPPRPGARLSHALKYKGGETRVELLTPGGGKPGVIKLVPSLAFGAQSLPYLDYLLHKPARATYLHDAGVSVFVPDPARYALHKLIVAASRPSLERGKIAKDMVQATSLLELLANRQLQELQQAARALERHGESYLRQARKGAQALAPEIRALLPANLRK